jgi:hypothetical protein
LTNSLAGWDGGVVDQRRQAGGEDDAAELSSIPVEWSAAMAEPDRLQLGKPVAAAGAAEEDRELVADQLTATVTGGRLIKHAHINHKNFDLKQYFKEGRGCRTEGTFRNPKLGPRRNRHGG